MVGVVEDVDVAAADPAAVALDHHLDGLAHGAEVHRHVRGVGDQAAVGVEDRAGEVEPLLDVDRVRGGLQAHAHLFGHRHEQVVEDLQHHRVGGRVHVRPVRPGGDAGQQQVAAAGHHGPPARLDHGGGEFLGDDGRAVDDVPGPAARPARTGRPRPSSPPVNIGPDACASGWLSRTGRVIRRPRSAAARRQLQPTTSTDTASTMTGLPGMRKEKRREYSASNAAVIVRQRADRDDDRGVGALVAQVRPVHGGDPLRRHALGGHLGPGVLLERVGVLGQPLEALAGQRHLDGLLAHGDDVGQPDPVRGQHAGQRVDEHPGHAQRVGDRAGVLPARAAEHVQDVLGDVVAALHRDLLDRVGHVRHGDLGEPGRDLLRAAGVAGVRGDLLAEFGKFRFRNIRVERLVAAGAEDLREVVRLDAAEQHVGVGDGERAAAAVAGGPGIGAGRVGPGPVPAAVEVQDGAAARGHGVDGQHRGAHPHPGDLGLVLALELAREVRHVGGGAAHVEADHLGVARVRARSWPCRRSRRPGRTGWSPCRGSPPRRSARRWTA